MDFNDVAITTLDYNGSNLQFGVKTGSGAYGSLYWWAAGKSGTASFGSSFHFSLNLNLSAQDGYSAQIAWNCGGISGPRSPGVPILAVPPAILFVQYTDDPTGPTIELAWNPVANFTGDYRVTLQASGQSSIIGTTSATTYSFTLAAPLSGTNNTVSVQCVETTGTATISGPPGTTVIPNA